MFASGGDRKLATLGRPAVYGREQKIPSCRLHMSRPSSGKNGKVAFRPPSSRYKLRRVCPKQTSRHAKAKVGHGLSFLTTSSITFASVMRSASAVNSAGLWLIPSLDGTKIRYLALIPEMPGERFAWRGHELDLLGRTELRSHAIHRALE